MGAAAAPPVAERRRRRAPAPPSSRPRRRDDPLDRLFALEQFGIKLGLDNIARICRRARPSRARVSRRSTSPAPTAKARSRRWSTPALRAAGYRTGRYTSPHLVDLDERFVIDGQPGRRRRARRGGRRRARRASIALRADGVLQVQPTFFEVDHGDRRSSCSAARGVEVAVIEVGLGGRFDATNVIAPVVTRDHLDRLRPPAASRRHARADRLREGRHHQAGRAGRDRPHCRAVRPPRADRGEVGATIAVARVRRRSRRRSLRTHRGAITTLGGLRGASSASTTRAVAVRLLEALDTRGLSVAPRRDRSGAGERPSGRGGSTCRRLADGREAAARRRAQPGRRGGARVLSARRPERCSAARLRGDARQGHLDSMLRALLPVVSRLVVTRASNPRSADPASSPSRRGRSRRTCRSQLSRLGVERARGARGARRRASSSRDRSSCSATFCREIQPVVITLRRQIPE